MAVILDQTRLDAVSKKRANLFNWRGQFTPEFVEYILHQFAKSGDHILDPFSGSGTVLQESAKLNIKASGLEINPSAFEMSSFFEFCNHDDSKRKMFCDNFYLKLNVELEQLNGQMIFSQGDNYRDSYAQLLTFIERVLPLFTEKFERTFLLNILFQSEKDKKLTVKESINKSFQYIRQCLLELPFTNHKIAAYLADARCADSSISNDVDLVLTSPPYINVFNYHQNYRAIVESVQYDVLKVASSEFGANRKHRGNRFKTVIQYCIDMEMAIRSFWEVLKTGGQVVMILGRESNVRGVAFLNGQLIVEIMESCGGFSDVKILERKFMNKFGTNIKEDILIAKKIDATLIEERFARAIAVKHLRNALTNANEEIQVDIADAINNSDNVFASMLFNPKQIMK